MEFISRGEKRMNEQNNQLLIERYVDEHMKPENEKEREKWIKYFIFILLN